MLTRTLSMSKLKRYLPFSIILTRINPSPPPHNLIFHTPLSSFITNSYLPFNRDGNYEDSLPSSLPVCPGCGVHMQNSDSTRPGFSISPSVKPPDYKLRIDRRIIAEEPEISHSLKKGFLEPEDPDTVHPSKPVVCARCHSLRHYGRVKDPMLENLLPDFDFNHTVGRRLATSKGIRSIALIVTDASDFDGSFPRKVAKLLSKTIDENHRSWKEGKSGNVPRMILVITKIDLLPSSVSPTRLEHWVRQRAKRGGADEITSVHFVSSLKDWGVRNLVEDVCGLIGNRGNVWAIGTQNAGKSSLINAMGRHAGGKVLHLTEAPVSGTTLGIVKVEGIFPGQAKLFDTPGLLNPHALFTRLNRDEQKLVQISKELRPRTYRIKVGYSVHIAGLMRLDFEESTLDTIYVTVWASLLLPLHMGKTENAYTMVENHFGRQLQFAIKEECTKNVVLTR